MSLDEASEAYAEGLGLHMSGRCDPLCCPWCHDEDQDVEDFEPDPEDA